MDKVQIETLNKLLYEYDDNQNIIEELRETKDSKIIHLYAHNYNWDDGFDIPNTIIDNKFCDIATALLLFYNCEGDVYLLDNEVSENEKDIDWSNFIEKLYNKINNLEFNSNNIKFDVPLTKIQKFKISKVLNEKDIVFVCDIPGEDINIEI